MPVTTTLVHPDDLLSMCHIGSFNILSTQVLRMQDRLTFSGLFSWRRVDDGHLSDRRTGFKGIGGSSGAFPYHFSERLEMSYNITEYSLGSGATAIAAGSF